MKTILFLLTIVLVAPAPAMARIGENADELVKRYGPVVETITHDKAPDFPQYRFTVGTVNIRVRFLNGLSAQEIFYRENGGLSSEEIKDILEANKQDSSWEFSTSEKYFIHYRRADEKAKASVMHGSGGDPSKDNLMISTVEMDRATGKDSKF